MSKKVRSIAPAQRSVIRYKKQLAVLFAVVVGFFGTLGLNYILVSATVSPWTQTNWNGGTGSGTVSSTVTTYSSQSNLDTTTTAGQFSLSQTAGWSSTYSSWSRRQTVSITNSSSSLTDYQVRVSITYDSDMQADFDDIRFATTADSALNFWLDHKTNSTSAVYWVKVPSIPNGSSTFYMYYGNPSATSASSGANTFVFFDDFSGNALDSDKWTITGTSGDFSINNKLSITSGGCGGWARSGLYSDSTFDRTNGMVTEFRYKPTGWTSSGCIDGGAVMLGFLQETTSINYNTLAHGIYDVWNGDTNMVYENGSGTSPAGFTSSLTIDQEYDLKIEARPTATAGAKYYYSTNKGDTYTNFHTSSSVITTPLRVGFVNYNQNFDLYNWRVRQYATSEPSASVATEEIKYATSGNLVSNILDAEFAADWGTLIYTTSGTGTVNVKVRTASSSDMSDASDWSTCDLVTSSTDLTANNCVDDTDRYAQYYISIEGTGAATPVFEDISIAFSASDSIKPTANATTVSISGYSSGSWVNVEPTLTWTSGSDNVGGIGLLGYCVALDEVAVAGTTTSLDPELSAGVLTGIDDGVSSNFCPFILTSTSFNLSAVSGLNLTTNKKYFFSIKAVDSAGNVYTGSSENYQDLVNFKYDNTVPTNVTYISTPSGNFGSINDMFFTWPISGAGAAGDNQSDIVGWQYSLNGTSNWKGPDTNSALGITYIEDDGNTSSHTFTEGDDGDDIVVGTNTIYFRAVDTAGNFSTSVTGGISYGGAAPTFTGGSTVTITPSSSTSNNYALSWDAATPSAGTIDSYYYMINTTPPATLATLTGNSTQYIPATGTSVTAQKLVGAVKGSNTVYVVAVDTEDNYSPSNNISGSFTLNSTSPDAAQNLSASDTSIKSEEIWRVSLAWDEPEYKGTGTLTYIVERSTDNSTWSEVETSTGTSYTDSTPESTTYYYRIGTYDTSDESEDDPTYTSSVEIIPKGTYESAPTLSSGPTVSDITTRKAFLKWSTSRAADSRVQYGIKSGDYFEEEPSKSDLVTSHEILLTNLRPGTKYYYKVKWTDEDGNIGISSEKTFSTDPAPKIGDIKVTSIGINSASVSFTAQNSTKIKIYYGISKSYGSAVEQNTSTAEATYRVPLSDLDDGTKYFFKVNAFDSEDEEYEGNDLDFETLPRPQITNVRIQQAKNTAQPTAVISWNTNTAVTSIVTYYPTGNPSAARDEIEIALKEGNHQSIVRGLLPNTVYDLKVSGRDQAGNEAESSLQTFTTATDTRAPLISELKIEGSTAAIKTQVGEAQLVVSWTTDEPSTSQVEFGEGTGTQYAQKTQKDVNLTFNHLVVIPNLTPSKVYHLRALSADRAGNVTNSVDVVTITPKATDNALDLVFNNLREVFGFIGN